MYIVISILLIKNAKERRNVHFSLLLGMAIMDIVGYLFFFASTRPMPAETEPVFGARGTTTTCDVQGFFFPNEFCRIVAQWGL